MKEEIKTKENGDLYFEKEIPENLKSNIMFRILIESGEISLVKNIIGASPNDLIKINEKDYLLKNIEIVEDKLIFSIRKVL